MKERNYTAWLIVIALLLLALVAIEGYRVAQEVRAARAKTEMVETITLLVNQQRVAIETALEDYHEAAYEDERIERIAEQQLIAAEWQMVLLQTLALQNGQILEVLASQ